MSSKTTGRFWNHSQHPADNRHEPPRSILCAQFSFSSPSTQESNLPFVFLYVSKTGSLTLEVPFCSWFRSLAILWVLSLNYWNVYRGWIQTWDIQNLLRVLTKIIQQMKLHFEQQRLKLSCSSIIIYLFKLCTFILWQVVPLALLPVRLLPRYKWPDSSKCTR